jgi:hypothetical protein
LAFAEVLVQDRPLTADERRDLIEHIDDWARTLPDQLAFYRRAARLLDRLAGKPFADLLIPDRIALLDRHQLRARSVPVEQDPDSIAEDARAIRSRVVPALIEGYWSSSAGWVAVGYEVFPGRCGDLTRYTRREP